MVAKREQASQLGEARDSVVRSISEHVTKILAAKLDNLIFTALCLHIGGPNFEFADLRGRCECVKQKGKADRYLLDGRLILEIDWDHTPDRDFDPPRVLECLRGVEAGFCYRIVPPPERTS